METGNLDPHGDQSPHKDDPLDIEKRRLVSDFFNAGRNSDLPPIRDPVILRQIMLLADAIELVP